VYIGIVQELWIRDVLAKDRLYIIGIIDMFVKRFIIELSFPECMRFSIDETICKASWYMLIISYQKYLGSEVCSNSLYLELVPPITEKTLR